MAQKMDLMRNSISASGLLLRRFDQRVQHMCKPFCSSGIQTITPDLSKPFRPNQPTRWCRLKLLWFLILIPALGMLAGCSSPAPPIPSVDTVGIQLVADGLTSPVTMAVPPDGTKRLFMADQTGQIYIVDPNQGILSQPFLDIANRMVTLNPNFDERGLLGLAFHPDYATNGRFFVLYSAPPGPTVPAGWDSELHISEFQVSEVSANLANPASERILLTIPKPQANHNGGTVVFGPDGYLYITVGDGGGANDAGPGHAPGLGNAQDRSKFLGKVLRIDVNTGTPYGIPADNPFVGDPNALPEIWALGLRNPYRASFDIGGDQRMFLGDAGQDLYEEVDIITRGGNYGWNIREGTQCFDPNNPTVPPATCPTVDANGQPLLNPIIEYAHTDAQGNSFGTTVIGGYVYRGSLLPGLVGQYIFGDFSTAFASPDGSIFAATEDAAGNWSFRTLAIGGQPNGRLGRYVLGFGQDADGEVYVLTTANTGPTGSTGQVYKFVSAP